LESPLHKGVGRSRVCVFLIASALSPGPGSSIGMPWSVFYCTWGVMLLAAVLAIVGYVGCKLNGDKISIFYIISPLLLIVALSVWINLHEIIRTILHYEGF